MKRILLFVLLFLHLGCATKMNDQILEQKWEGQHIDDYISVSGKPNLTFKAPNDNMIHVYHYVHGGGGPSDNTIIETDANGKIINVKISRGAK